MFEKIGVLILLRIEFLQLFLKDVDSGLQLAGLFDVLRNLLCLRNRLIALLTGLEEILFHLLVQV